MIRACRQASLLLLFLAGALLAACDLSAPFQWGEPASRILFIGNSFTFFNGGVGQALKRLAGNVEVHELAVGGFSLEDHWSRGDAAQTIRNGNWNYVVLQDQSQNPAMNWANFLMYAAKFDAEIDATGAQTVLFMTWARPDSVQYGVTTRSLANAYYSAGSRLGAEVAPVGLAFANALAARPDLLLNVQDGHPTVAGTYLAACVLYATFFDKSPVGIRSLKGLADADKEFLQQVAARTLGY